MDAWLFLGSNGTYALTGDANGSILPGEFGPWARLTPYRLNGGETDEDEALRLLSEHGYVCFD